MMKEAMNLTGTINREFILGNAFWCAEPKTTEKKPYVTISVYDLDMYLRVPIDDETSFRVTRKNLDAFGLVLDEVADAAVKNTRAKIEIKNLGEVLCGEYDPNVPDVVTANGYSFGAGAIWLTDIFENLCKKHGVEKCYILPSSVHEILVQYVCERKEDFDRMVKEINEKQLAPEDRLADHCYVYELGNDELKY